MARGLLQSLLVNNSRELLAAGLGGAVGTCIDVALLVLLVETGSAVPVAAFLAASAGGAMNFGLNKYIAFRDRSPITIQQLSRFGVVAVVAALLMALAMNLVAVQLGVPYLAAKLVCAVAIFAAWTYPAQRRIVFARPRARATWRLDVDHDAGASAA